MLTVPIVALVLAAEPIAELSLSQTGSFACARYAGGRVACAGDNSVGQLGRGEDGAVNPKLFEDKQQPPMVVPRVADARKVVCAYAHTCALARGGVWCWGIGGGGELGWGEFRADPSPQLILDTLEAQGLALGEAHGCLITKDGGVACWGRNDEGQLGDGTAEKRSTPIAVKGLTKVKQLALGARHSCALKADGTVSCWGFGHQAAPVAGLTKVDELVAMAAGTCARSGSVVRCWERDGKVREEKALKGASRLFADGLTACAVVARGALACAGARAAPRCSVGGDGRAHCADDVKPRAVVERL